MNIINRRLYYISLIFLLASCNATGNNDNTIVLIKTTLGEIKIKLYDDTPIHRDNFIKLASSGIYDNILFHRIVKDFMIQSGDPSTGKSKNQVPDSLSNFTLPPEFNSSHFHKKGALAAARRGNEENPDLRSSGTQFYIVQGIKQTDSDLDLAEQQINSNLKQAIFNRIIHHTSDSLRTSGKTPSDAEIQQLSTDKIFNSLAYLKPYKITTDQRDIYKSSGGVPRLDGTYTVFGEVIEGLNVVDMIANTPTDRNEKPLDAVRIIKIKVFKK